MELKEQIVYNDWFKADLNEKTYGSILGELGFAHLQILPSSARRLSLTPIFGRLNIAESAPIADASTYLSNLSTSVLLELLKICWTLLSRALRTSSILAR